MSTRLMRSPTQDSRWTIGGGFILGGWLTAQPATFGVSCYGAQRLLLNSVVILAGLKQLSHSECRR
jgi:hypothetical protein